jgi:broad specificity phosphatase PhoE
MMLPPSNSLAMAKRARLVLVRHGETVGNSSIRYYGRTNVALSDLGRRQMRAVRDLLRDVRGIHRFAAVYTSPLIRASESARIVAGADVTPAVIEEFAEVDFGLFEGLTAEEIRARYPVEFQRWNQNRLAADFVYPDGESRAAFAERVARGISRMLARWHEGRDGDGGDAAVLVVAHRGVIRAVISELAGIDTARIEIASIQVIEQGQGGADLRRARWRPVVLDLVAPSFDP